MQWLQDPNQSNVDNPMYSMIQKHWTQIRMSIFPELYMVCE